ncbi:hypothetical protein CW700_01160 [Candidatus Bathyarchaeota archaeon]|nr:hypothetical protein [Candidatus Bathyarchaeota archaeon]RJS90335.1 MAG: hypothetical protein CW700_01160 [Candidatus Bathyarchaeota archaeon]
MIPIDRHINRIAHRTGIVEGNAGYDEVRRRLEEAADEDQYLDIHLALIQFGREVCRARNPRCSECFLRDLCPTFQERQEKNAANEIGAAAGI